jgi:arylformamidase
MAKTQWYDITLPLNQEIPIPPPIPPQPGVPAQQNQAPPPKVYRFFDVEKGDIVTMSRIEMSTHDGTHIDSPLHFIPGGTTIDAMPFETTLGPCRVIKIKDDKEVTVKELESYNIQAGERILFKTKNSSPAGVYSTRQWMGQLVAVSLGAAEYLVQKKIRLVGIDYISIAHAEPRENIMKVHKTFLSNDIFILEAINLAGVPAGDYELICLPLRIEKGDAGPCRVILTKE